MPSTHQLFFRNAEFVDDHMGLDASQFQTLGIIGAYGGVQHENPEAQSMMIHCSHFLKQLQMILDDIRWNNGDILGYIGGSCSMTNHDKLQTDHTWSLATVNCQPSAWDSMGRRWDDPMIPWSDDPSSYRLGIFFGDIPQASVAMNLNMNLSRPGQIISDYPHKPTGTY